MINMQFLCSRTAPNAKRIQVRKIKINISECNKNLIYSMNEFLFNKRRELLNSWWSCELLIIVRGSIIKTQKYIVILFYKLEQNAY